MYTYTAGGWQGDSVGVLAKEMKTKNKCSQDTISTDELFSFVLTIFL